MHIQAFFRGVLVRAMTKKRKVGVSVVRSLIDGEQHNDSEFVGLVTQISLLVKAGLKLPKLVANTICVHQTRRTPDSTS